MSKIMNCGAIMGNTLNNQKTGCFLKRNNLINQRINHFVQELHVHLLELKIINLTIQKLKNKSYQSFDSLIGDRKCQTRTSIMLDILQDHQLLNNELKTIAVKIQPIIAQTANILKEIETASYPKLKNLTNELYQFSFQDYLNKHNLNIVISEQLTTASLCLFTAIPKQNLQDLCLNNISSNKIDKLLVRAKIALCKISTEYEQKLSKNQGCQDEQKLLTQIETKGFSSMTATFPSIKHILKKMKAYKQSLILKTTYFCSCGSIQNQKTKLFVSNTNNFIRSVFNNLQSDQAIMILEGYQFQGSFSQLKKLLNIDQEATLIPKEFYKDCVNSCPSMLQKIDNIEETIIAGLTQHPQFINDAHINFDGLELIGSNPHREYEYLLSIPGVSRNDMSKFYAYHCYPSTIKDALKADTLSTKIQNNCGNNSSIMTMPIMQQQPKIADHAHAHCPC